MESLRLMQRRTLQQLLQTRPSSQSFRLLHQSSKQSFRTRPSPSSTFSHFSHSPRPSPSPFARAARRTFQRSARRFESPTAETANENLSLTQRMKKLSREYGWSALGVYLLLTALDFPFCFLAVRLIGTDKIGHWEHIIVTWIKETITYPMPAGQSEAKEQVEDASEQVETIVKAPLEEVRDGEKRVLEEGETYVVADHGYREAEKAASGSNASLWTQLVLAYAIHKSFIFIRVPLTAAVTPKVVKTLRGWGWNIGKMPKRESFRRNRGAGSSAGVNTKGTGVKPDD